MKKIKINWSVVLEWGLTIGGAIIMGVGQVIGTHNTVKDEIDELSKKGKEVIDEDR